MMREIVRVALPYWRWEDYLAGLYGKPTGPDETVRARNLLACPRRLLPAMRAAVRAWPNAAMHQLSNMEQNRRAWLGWAACWMRANASALATRSAWPQLTDDERAAANACADTVIADWEAANAGRGYQMSLFDLAEEAGSV